MPADARPILGKTEIHRTLDTRDEAEALAALPEAMEKLDDLVEVAKTFSDAIGTTDLSEQVLKDIFNLNKDRLKPVSREKTDEIAFITSTTTKMLKYYPPVKSDNKNILPDWKFNHRTLTGKIKLPPVIGRTLTQQLCL